jgi:Lar family restriction alleviation protein
MSDAETLGTCPFCGGAAHLVDDRGDNGCESLLYRPQCKMCGGGLGGFDTKAQAIAAWNRRPHQDAGMREVVARIVDPEAWEEYLLEDGRVDPEVASIFQDAYEESLVKADAILSTIQGAEPVGWRIKDFADGWIYTHDADLVRSSVQDGALVEPLYAAPPPPDAGLVGELVEGLRPFARYAEAMRHMGGNYPKSGTLIAIETSVTGSREVLVEEFERAAALLARAEQGGA